MKTILRVTIFALAIIFSSNLMAQENNETNYNLLHFYDSELFNWSYNMFNGLSLNYLNQSSSTIYGINQTMQNALLLYPESGQEYKSYRWKNITGNIFMWGGLAMALSAFIPIIMDTNENDISRMNANISLGLSFGGFASVIAGTFFYASGQENIFNAVNIFNRHKIREYR